MKKLIGACLEIRPVAGMFALGLCIGAVFGLLDASDGKPSSFEEGIFYAAVLLGLAGLQLLGHHPEGVGVLGIATHWLPTIVVVQAGLVPLSQSVQVIALGVYGVVFLAINISWFFVGPTPPVFQQLKDKFRKEA